MKTNIISIFIVLNACTAVKVSKKIVEIKAKKIERRIEKTVDCAKDEADILKEISNQCMIAFSDEIKDLKSNQCQKM